jgi:hypothetical protein
VSTRHGINREESVFVKIPKFLVTTVATGVILAFSGGALAVTGGIANAAPAAPASVHLVAAVRPAVTSQTAGLRTLAVESNGTRVLLTSSGSLIVAGPSGAVVPDGFNCRRFGFIPTCGYEFTAAQTEVVYKAAVAGGAAALGVACHKLGIPTEVCSAIASAAGTVVGVLVGQYTKDKCLYISLAPPGFIRIVTC